VRDRGRCDESEETDEKRGDAKAIRHSCRC
jgi:hypothetical protein